MSHPTTPKYDVFLSFRGEDTREKFTSHVYAKLEGKKIKTFIDYRIESGDEVSSALIEAIEESLIYLVILSEHYASSRWCLDELIKILECKEKYGREVIPVFYEVNPTDVRLQTGSYGQDFLEHHQHRPKDKIDAWKAALTHVANLSGLESQKFSPESTLVEKIAEVILEKMNRHVSSDYDKGLTRMDKHINQIQPKLQLESPTVRIIGIWGMGGIGKTTIANAIFEKLAIDFSSSSKVLNVQEQIERAGVDHVKRKYLKELLKEDITSSNYNFSYQRLKRTKVLLILDDVKDYDQDLIGTHGNFGQGSRIIVTSRDKHVLENANADEIYQVSEMDDQDSLQLFCSFAFKQKQPIESYVSLTEKFLIYSDGLPLALKVLGSMLCGKPKEVWKSQLQKLEKLPNQDISKKLKLSYDGLDKEQKDIFLDIACFHIGEDHFYVERMLDGCGYSAHIGMEVLKDRCLIFISEYYEVGMHDLIKEMGQDIVLLEDDPRKRSRLWKPNDIYDVLSKKKGKGTDAIKGIFLDMMEIKKIQLDADTFNEMHNLRMIIFRNDDSKSNVTCSDDLKFPNNLKYLYWDGFPQRSLPQDSWPENLIAVKMRHSHLEQLWEGDLALPNLKILDLSYSEKLRAIPDLSLCPNIDEIRLYGCSNLEELPEVKEETMKNLKRLWLGGTAIKELPSSLDRLVGLEELSLLGCRKLKTIPSSIGNLSKLVRLELSYCSNLDELPEIMETMENLKVLNLDETSIKELPSSLHHLVGLVELSLESCRKLKTIPSSIGNLSKLLNLNLAGCESLETFPEIPNYCLSSLTELWLQGSSIVNLPESMAHLSSLKSLYLSDCKLLECVPKLPPNLNQVLAYDCPSIKRMMLNSRSDPGEGAFKFHLTNSQYSTSLSNIGEEACIKITDDEYRSVVFCFPGSAVPRWFQYCCKGHSVTMTKDSPNLCSKSRLIGFALCAVLRPEDMDESLIYKFEFISEGEIYSSSHCLLKNYLNWNCPDRSLKQDHTFLWKHDLYREAITNKLFLAQDFTFEFPSIGKEYGICPLYTKEIYTLKNRVGPKLQNCVV